jgi:hypothetical protein
VTTKPGLIASEIFSKLDILVSYLATPSFSRGSLSAVLTSEVCKCKLNNRWENGDILLFQSPRPRAVNELYRRKVKLDWFRSGSCSL